jgi:acyl carrier protein
MAQDEKSVFERVRAIVCEKLAVDPEKVTREAKLEKDLEADSLDGVEILMEIEDVFGIKIPEKVSEKFVTVGDIVKYFEERAQQ